MIGAIAVSLSSFVKLSLLEHQLYGNCAKQTFIKLVSVVFNTFFLSLLFLSCGSKVKTDDESINSGPGGQAHSQVRGDGVPAPDLQMVQGWQRAEEEQKSPNKEQPVSTSPSYPPTTADDYSKVTASFHTSMICDIKNFVMSLVTLYFNVSPDIGVNQKKNGNRSSSFLTLWFFHFPSTEIYFTHKRSFYRLKAFTNNTCNIYLWHNS